MIKKNDDGLTSISLSSIVRLCAFSLLPVLAAGSVQASTVIAGNSGGGTVGTYYPGQSFTVTGSDYYNNVSLSLYSLSGSQEAFGNLYLFTSAYTGSPTGLASAPGLLAKASASNGAYLFDPSVTLKGGAQYFGYVDTSFQLLAAGGDFAPGGSLYMATGNGTSNFSNLPTYDARFQVLGSPGAVLAGNTSGGTVGTYYPGQSFIVGGSGYYNNVTFNFYDLSQVPEASGNLYLFAAPYSGSATNLATATGVLAKATAANGLYTFDPTFTLSGGTQYYAYSDASFQSLAGGGNFYSGGSLYMANGTGDFSNLSTYDARFKVAAASALAAVPEPATWAMTMLGFGMAGWTLRQPQKRRLRAR